MGPKWCRIFPLATTNWLSLPAKTKYSAIVDKPARRNSKGNPFSGGVKYTGGGKNWRFSTEIAVYLGNGARKADGYYGTLIGSHGLNGIMFDDCE